MQFDDPQQHVVTFECAPSDTNSVVHLLSADGCCGNCGAFCYRPQEIAGSVCPRVCVTLDSPQLCSLYLCVCASRICVFVLPVFLAQVHNVAFCVSSCVHFVTLPRLLFNCLHFCICTFRLLYLPQCTMYCWYGILAACTIMLLFIWFLYLVSRITTLQSNLCTT